MAKWYYSSRGYTGFHLAAWNGYTEKVREKLQEEDFDFDVPTRDSNTPFALAAHGGHLDVFTILLQRGANVNNADHELDTPIHYAVSNKSLVMTKKLIERGADVNVANKYGVTPLWVAVYTCDIDVLKLLLFHHADMSACSTGCKLIQRYGRVYNKPRSLLYVAIDKQSTECISVLLQAGYDVHKEEWLHGADYPMKSYWCSEDDDDSKEFRRMLTLLNVLSTKPPTLLSQCRTFLRKYYGKKLSTEIDEFEIPNHLKNYLTLTDLCCSVLES